MRKKWAKTSAKVALLTAGLVVIGSGAGYAADLTSGDFGAGSGNQLHAPVSVPINASGNSGSVLGQARAKSLSGASVHNREHSMLTSGKFALVGGNQADTPVSAPINVTGNALTGGGQAWSLAKGYADVVNGHGRHHHGSWAQSKVANVTDTARKAVPQAAASPTMPSPLSSLTDSVRALPGTQALTQATKTLPLSKLPLKKKLKQRHHLMGSGHDGGMFSHGDFGLLSGNQAYVPVSAPINACGNAAAVLGQAFAACKGSASVHNHGAGSGGMYTSGRFGALGGNQLDAPLSAPVNLCGNAASLGGQALALCKGRATVHNGDGRHHRVYTPRASMPELPQAPAPRPQQGPVPAPKLPKPKLPKLPVTVKQPKHCDCGPAPMATTPQVPSLAVDKPQAPKLALPKPQAPKVTLPKPKLPKVEVPKQQAPKVSLPKPQAPKAEVTLPAAPHKASGCGCLPQAHSITGGDDNSVIHMAKRHDTAGDLTSGVLNDRESPVRLTDTITSVK